MRKYILITFIITIGTISLLKSQTIDSEKIEENVLKKFQKKLIDDGEAGGNVVLVNKNGKKIYHHNSSYT